MSASTSPAPPVEPPTENLNDLSLSSSDKTESIPIPTPSPPSQTTSQVNEQGAEQPVMDIEPPTPPTSNPTPNSAGMNNSPSVLARDMLLPSTSNTSLNSHSGSSQGISEGGSRVSSLESSLASPPRSTPGSNLGSGLAQRSGGLGSSNGSRISGLPASSNSGTSSSSPVPTPVPGAAASGFPGRTGGGARIPVGLGSRPGLGGLSAQGGGSKLPPSLQAKIDAMATRNKAGANATPTPANGQDSSSTSSLLASAANRAAQPTPTTPARAPVLGGLAARRAASSGAGGLSGGLGGGPRPTPTLARQGAPVLPPSGLGGGPGRRLNRPGGMTLSSMAGPTGGGLAAGGGFSNFSKIVDPSGKLNFDKKAILHAEGVNFSNGATYKINKDEMILQDELGKGNYGEVRKVYHKTTKVTMAMKEIRLELDESKLNQIIMELDILHRAIAPEIIEFYGAFMVESCVYYCMEFMDAGSMDALNLNGIPEKELARITKSMIKGLKFLKDEMQVMHRDVKPTNLLANKKGQIKLCDFGVSGQLEKSLAKTNIGCQSYMAPERIKGESTGQVSTYTVSSDIWSVGLTIIELAMGCYPYPPETYSNVFAQLQAIVHGPPPRLPEGFSDNAQDFVARCLLKQPDARPTYAQLLEHPWMKEDEEREVDMVGWVAKALEVRAARRSTGAAQSSSGPEVAEGHATGPAATQPTQTANADPSAPPPAPSN